MYYYLVISGEIVEVTKARYERATECGLDFDSHFAHTINCDNKVKAKLTKFEDFIVVETTDGVLFPIVSRDKQDLKNKFLFVVVNRLWELNFKELKMFLELLELRKKYDSLKKDYDFLTEKQIDLQKQYDAAIELLKERQEESDMESYED